jgi:hypothetical protein
MPLFPAIFGVPQSLTSASNPVPAIKKADFAGFFSACLRLA